MPAKNTLKIYVNDCYYHLYNRGVEHRNIFLCPEDYLTLLHLFEVYLLDNPHRPQRLKTLSGRLDLMAFCLMPNHFHLLIKQHDKTAMTEFVRRVFTTYAMYFNKKYKRAGTLFESRYKAVLIDKAEYLLHLSRYIHQNPVNLLKKGQRLEEYPYSSLIYYLNQTHPDWLKTEEILGILKDEFGRRTSYKDFLKENKIANPLLTYENISLD